MPSPFPGMNPYLEQEDVWRDFRLCFIVAASRQLHLLLPPHFYAAIRPNEFYFGMSDLDRSDPLEPDAVVNADPAGPLVVRIPTTDVERQSYIEVVEAKSKEGVAVIELLGCSAKFTDSHPIRQQYLAHRNRIMRSAAHFVEIDLLRGGERLPGNQAPGSGYCALVSRWQQRPWAEVWPIRLREPLPKLPIPLADGVPDVQLDLQAILQEVYGNSRYDYYIYDSEPDPPLSADDAFWARQLVRHCNPTP